ncbi:hypothetical protein EGT67_08960 [Prescottella agglutinans]|uniref:Lipoprotein n=1 Tax=Prescottella agglutinans TaxID=1644129 RepID=A0A438BF06_9NOCA|nr:hypothetical protein [Prescottella agglutinans]RVW09600.1 hypothetical protein EGT67_08960 [Prescottella agglutinans]
MSIKSKSSVIATAAVALALLAGCSSSTTEAASDPTTTTAAAATCTATPITDEALQSAVAGAALPEGVVIVSGVNQKNIEHPGTQDIIVRVCKPGLTGNALKDVATELARSIKASPLQVQTMRVTNTAEESSPEGKVRCEDFPARTFSAEADPGAVRTSWKYPSQ